MRRPPQTDRPRRAGFTLVELLVVILILAILIALLVPAISGAVRAANDARISAEISNIATALAGFKQDYGDYPPSRIILYNNCYYPTSDTTLLSSTFGDWPSPADITFGDLAQRTVRYMKKFFPRAAPFFNTQGASGVTLPWAAGGSYVILQGHECLVFFLGGMPIQANSGPTASFTLSGFARDPVQPFNTALTNRTTPYFDFAGSRIVDTYNLNLASAASSGIPAAPNGFPSYIDPVSSSGDPRPYAYFSAYGNNGYDPNDDNSAAYDNAGFGQTTERDDYSNILARAFFVNYRVNATSSQFATSAAPNPYTSTDPMVTKPSWLNPSTFQLISAGRDGQWGLGGGYEATSTGNKLPYYANDNGHVNTGSAASPQALILLDRKREDDNVANFSNGKLQ